MISVVYKDLGLIRYAEGWHEQQMLFDALIAKKMGDNAYADAMQTLLVCEHPHVYTLGKSGHESNMLITPEFLKNIGAEYFHIDRGGDITYHGPGQVVGYPILDIEELGIGLKDYVHKLEQAVIDTIAEFGIKGGRSAGATGVWLSAGGGKAERKICAIGVRSSHFVTMHGFALNVNTDLKYFTYINPCGFVDKGVTSMEQELGGTVSMDEVKSVFAAKFAEGFGVELLNF
jgi:lipoyl(octanoyl) transferase